MRFPSYKDSRPKGTSVFAVCLFVAVTGSALADEPAASPPFLSVELNTLVQQDGSCRMIFLVENTLGADLETAVFETVLFKTDGSVDRLTLFDFQKLPQGRPRVRQFDIPDTGCDALGRVLINDVHSCKGDGITDADCIKGLKLTTKTSVEVLG